MVDMPQKQSKPSQHLNMFRGNKYLCSKIYFNIVETIITSLLIESMSVLNE